MMVGIVRVQAMTSHAANTPIATHLCKLPSTIVRCMYLSSRQPFIAGTRSAFFVDRGKEISGPGNLRMHARHIYPQPSTIHRGYPYLNTASSVQQTCPKLGLHCGCPKGDFWSRDLSDSQLRRGSIGATELTPKTVLSSELCESAKLFRQCRFRAPEMSGACMARRGWLIQASISGRARAVCAAVRLSSIQG